MEESILEPDYDGVFDDVRFPLEANMLLRGLAAVIQDSHPTWRPRVSELVKLLPQSEQSNALMLAGSAYGAARAIQDRFPGPAILLYGAALNVAGSAPQIQLRSSIESAEEKLKSFSCLDDPDIRELVRAAKERASFDKVSEMLRQEFSSGLRRSGKYNDDEIAYAVPRIVSATHDVRHMGLVYSNTHFFTLPAIISPNAMSARSSAAMPMPGVAPVGHSGHSSPCGP